MPLPENNGLLTDDNYIYLSLLKRYVLYGPTLGFTSPQFASGGKPGGGGGSNMGSVVGGPTMQRSMSVVQR